MPIDRTPTPVPTRRAPRLRPCATARSRAVRGGWGLLLLGLSALQLAGCSSGEEAAAEAGAHDAGASDAGGLDAGAPDSGALDAGVSDGGASDAGCSQGAACCPAGVTAGSPNPDHTHVAIGVPVVYPTNPPSGGPHWPVWARWGVHSTAVPVEYLVHNQEHGGVILFYNLARCTDGCAGLVEALTAFIDSLPQDPLCTVQRNGVHARVVLTADPDLDVVWAAAAWGWTYKASGACVNSSALRAFVDAHYGQGSEAECVQGGFD